MQEQRTATVTVDDRLDGIVAEFGVRFDGVRDRALTFVPIEGNAISDPDAMIDRIIYKLENNEIINDLGDVDSVRLVP